jgi:3D (Asp-Asp-Asp) domain-containing protein
MTGPDRGAAHAATLVPRAAVPRRALRILESAPAKAAAEKTARLSASRSVKGKHWVQVWATAYCPTCKICETGRRTATGRHAFTHGVAVSAHGKRAVALGSRVYVPHFGWLPVDDTGGKVQGNQIDIRMATHRHAQQWGRRLVRICLERS